MDKLFLTVLNMSLTGAFVIAVIILARLPLKKAPKIISYCLWAVAGFRLVFPFSIESVFSLMPFKAQPIPSNIATQAVPRIDSGIPYINNAVSSVLPAATPAASVNPLQIWTDVGAYVWLIGAVAMLLYGIISYALLKRRMRTAIRVEGNIYETDNIQSPFVLGIIKPKIYLPLSLAAGEREYIILHERTHIRRRDHIIKFAAYFILCLHWFNPLAWVAFLLMGVDMEMCCDECVLKEMGGETKHDYSRSLLSLATQRRVIGGSPLAFGEGGVKERVKNVLNFRKPSRVIIVAAVAIVAVLSIGFAVNRVVTVDRAFPMYGINLSDLQTDSIIQNVSGIVGTDISNIYVPGYNNFQIQVTENFDWQLSGAVSIIYTKGNNRSYYCQLRNFPDDMEYYVTEPEQREPPQKQFHLFDYLDALKYLPQEYIRSLTHDNPDGYIINFVDSGFPDDGQPCVFYNSSGVTEKSGWRVRFDIQPMYLDEDGAGYHGVGSDVIHIFYGGLVVVNTIPGELTTPKYTPRKWLDYYNPRGDGSIPFNEALELELPEFPDTVFIWTAYQVKAVNAEGQRVLFEGMPVWNIFLADVSGDGLPELCATVSIGSGLIDTRVIVSDYASGAVYDLSDRGYYDYALSIEDNKLIVTQSDHYKDEVRSTGSMAIVDGELVTFGIDRTKPEIEPNVTPSQHDPGNYSDPVQALRTELEADGCAILNVFAVDWTTRQYALDGKEYEFVQIYAEYLDGPYSDAIYIMDYTLRRPADDNTAEWKHDEPVFWEGIAYGVAKYAAEQHYAETGRTNRITDMRPISIDDNTAYVPGDKRDWYTVVFNVGYENDPKSHPQQIAILISKDGQSHWQVAYWSGITPLE